MQIHTLVKRIAILSIISTVLMCSGCSVFMAAKQPDKKNVSLLAAGMPRAMIMGEFGTPVSTEKRSDNTRVDVYSFKQGYSKSAKIGRSLFHGVADVATLGLWEVVATPTEAAFDGKYIAFQVTYDASDRIIEVTQLKK
ncbi:hypothetical protein [Acinetobacter nectaris]|uniref:hypothetical protein n=1 Tax=Acinetobacter nectaris TaxID=1219382 RepID=UPI001F176715|nr:hypothetical protein [Acinetobacter nectaris]